MKKHTFIVSDESVNRYGYRVLTDGIDLTQFLKNPVGYFMHNRKLYQPTGDEVIVRWENIRTDEGQLLADAVFDESNEFSMKIYKKVKDGFIRMASIGIDPIEMSTDAELVLNGQTGATVTKSELLEISIVDRGGNNNALKLYGKDGKELIEVPKIETTNMKLLNTLQGTLNLSDANEDTIEAGVKAMIADRDKYKKLYDDQQNVIKTSKEKEAKELVEKAIADNVIDEAQKPAYEALFSADHENAKTVVNGLLAAKPQGKKIEGQLADFIEAIPKTDAGKTEVKDYAWYELNAPNELLKLKADDPKKFNELFNAHFGN